MIEFAGEVVSNHDELMSNFFAQPDALAYGKVGLLSTLGIRDIMLCMSRIPVNLYFILKNSFNH